MFAALPPAVETIYARADSGFYCWEAVEAYEKRGVQFIISARKTSRLVEELKAADWKRSPRTDADGQCEFRYQPEGWGKAYRFIALRYQKKPKPSAAEEPEQYQLFDTPEPRLGEEVGDRRALLVVAGPAPDGAAGLVQPLPADTPRRGRR